MDAVVTAARDCVALDRARRIADWVGSGKQVTSTGVLRPADVRLVAKEAGVALPEKFRSAADVPAWHRPWSVAVATGMVTIEQGRAVAAPPVDATLDAWLAGYAAAMAVAFSDEEGIAALRVAHGALTALAAGRARTAAELYRIVWHELADDYDFDYWRLRSAGGYEGSGALLVEILSEFGAIKQLRPTELGQWALSEVDKRGDDVIVGPVIPVGQICQLKITLKHMQPACWRRVLLPTRNTLGHLHWVIQAVMLWDNDHLHAFTVGHRQYGDPGFDMDDEYEIAIGQVFTSSRKSIRYTYDFGNDWQHEIALEKTFDAAPDATYPICVAGSGAVPVEDSRRRMIKFDQDDINRRLAGLPDLDDDPVLEKAVEMILVDAHDEDEQLSVFVTVLEEEVKFPAQATLLGSPVTVLELDYDEPLRGAFARCRGEHGEGEIALTDLCFPADTIAAWIHAAYRHFLGVEPFPVTSRPDWTWPPE